MRGANRKFEYSTSLSGVGTSAWKVFSGRGLVFSGGGGDRKVMDDCGAEGRRK